MPPCACCLWSMSLLEKQKSKKVSVVFCFVFFLERTQYFSKAVTPNSSNALITVNISSSQATLKQADKQSVLKALSCPQPKALSSLSSCVKSGLLIHRIHLKLGSPNTAVLQAVPAAQGDSLPILSLGSRLAGKCGIPLPGQKPWPSKELFGLAFCSCYSEALPPLNLLCVPKMIQFKGLCENTGTEPPGTLQSTRSAQGPRIEIRTGGTISLDLILSDLLFCKISSKKIWLSFKCPLINTISKQLLGMKTLWEEKREVITGTIVLGVVMEGADI